MEPKRTASEIGKSNVRRSKSHERRVAKLLTEWSGVEFRRRKVEGREESVIAKESTADVIPVSRNFIFSIEAKCGENFSLDALLVSPSTCLFTSWWFQTCYDAGLLTKYLGIPIYPMLFFKPLPAFDWVAFSPKVKLCDKNDIPRDNIWFPHLLFNYYDQLEITGNISHSKKNKILVTMKLDSAIICRWKTFADQVGPCGLFF